VVGDGVERLDDAMFFCSVSWWWWIEVGVPVRKRQGRRRLV